MSDIIDRIAKYNAPGWIGCAEARLLLAVAADEIARLRAEVARLEADAARYQWLVRNCVAETGDDDGTLCIYFQCDFENYNDPAAAIDAARAGGTK